jgi:hypothetical protein
MALGVDIQQSLGEYECNLVLEQLTLEENNPLRLPESILGHEGD